MPRWGKEKQVKVEVEVKVEGIIFT